MPDREFIVMFDVHKNWSCRGDRYLGHDILTVQEAGNAGLSDEQVLAFATQENWAVLTLNRRDCFRLHQLSSIHAGIVACKQDNNWNRFATNIYAAISLTNSFTHQVIRAYKR